MPFGHTIRKHNANGVDVAEDKLVYQLCVDESNGIPRLRR